MGTNYYLIKKCSKEEFDRYGYYSADFHSGEDYRELENGYVYCNRYYSSIEELEECLALTLHIGKSSAGWHFGLCIYPELNINNLDDWKKLFAGYEIYDEYNEEVSMEKMLNIITNRSAEDFKNMSQEEYENHIVANYNELCNNKFMKSRTVEDYEEYLITNNAERGLNGLLAHASSYYTRTDGTYDLTTVWDFC